MQQLPLRLPSVGLTLLLAWLAQPLLLLLLLLTLLIRL
jgi:hypothetical protein